MLKECSQRELYSLRFLLLLFVFNLFSTGVHSAELIRIRAPQSEFDASQDYFQGLLVLALEKNNIEITFEYAPYMVQGRALEELQHGRLLDVYWAGSDAAREGRLGVVNIPLIKGLLGYRVFLAHKERLELLKQATTLEDLKKLLLCQGSHWPDTDIMLAAGLRILPNPIYESMFSQVYLKRCDAFPRGINEALVELNIRKEKLPELILFQETILYYPFPMYFFTSPENTRLIQLIKSGLEKAIDDGSFDFYIKNHPSTKHLFPVTRWNNVNYIKLSNPFLPKETNINNSRYWLVPPKN